MRNTCTNMIGETKANFWKNELQNSNCSKSFWKIVKKFSGSSNLLTGPLSDKSAVITDDTQKANLMNRTFIKNLTIAITADKKIPL